MNIKEYILNEKYISEDTELIGNLTKIFNKEQNRVIILKSPQGTGKSNFINTLDHIYVSPTSLLTEQQYNEYGGIRAVGLERAFYQYVGADEDEFGDPQLEGKDIKTTFASSNTAELSNRKWFVIDEVHKLCDYSTFANESVINAIKQSLYHYRSGGNILFVSATPENFISDFKDLYEEYSISFDMYIKIKSQKGMRYINNLYVVDCKTTESFFNFIKEKERANYYNGKQIALLSSKKMIEKITEEQLEEGLSSIGIDSDNRKKSESEGGTKESFEELIKTKFMTHNIMNFTSMIDSGVSFEDNDIKNIYCMMPAGKVNITTGKQFFCRTRNSKPNAYIKLEHLNELDIRQLEYSDTELQEKYIKSALNQIDDYNNGFISENKLKYTIGVVKSKSGYKCSTKAIKQEIRSLNEKQQMSTFDGIRDAFEGYYERIEFLESGNTIEKELKDKCIQAVKQYCNRKIFKDEKNKLVHKLNELGVKGKQISRLAKIIGFRYTYNEHKCYYLIEL